MSRLQLDLSDKHDTLIEELKRLCQLSTKKDVVENALLLLGWAASQAHKGLAIAAVDEAHDLFKEIDTPALQGARATGRIVAPVEPAGRRRAVGS